jgi:hypothetical protein
LALRRAFLCVWLVRVRDAGAVPFDRRQRRARVMVRSFCRVQMRQRAGSAPVVLLLLLSLVFLPVSQFVQL